MMSSLHLKFVMTSYLGVPALHDQHSVADGTELFEDLGEVLGHLLEGQLNAFVFPMIQVIDQVFYGLQWNNHPDNRHTDMWHHRHKTSAKLLLQIQQEKQAHLILNLWPQFQPVFIWEQQFDDVTSQTKTVWHHLTHVDPLSNCAVALSSLVH